MLNFESRDVKADVFVFVFRYILGE